REYYISTEHRRIGPVFDTLIESKRKTSRKKGLSVGFVSLSIHAAIIAAAVAATLHAGQADHAVKVDTAMVYLEQHQEQKPPEQQPVQLDVQLKGFQTVVAPDIIPTNIPPVTRPGRDSGAGDGAGDHRHDG